MPPLFAGFPYEDFVTENPSAVSKRFEEIWPELPEVEWTVEELERAGIEAEEALEIMNRIDEFIMNRWGGRWDKSELITFVELHYVVFFANANAKRDNQAPFELIRFAAKNYAIGLVDGNMFTKIVARDVLRYQVWRGPKFLGAFHKAQMPTSNHAKRRHVDLDLLLILAQLDVTETSEEGIGNG